MRYRGETPLSDSADAQRMAQYLDACQACVDAWQDAWDFDCEALRLQSIGDIASAMHYNHAVGAAHARARQAMWAAEQAL